MNREQKSKLISQLQDKFVNSESTFLVNYRGLNVAAVQSLRAALRENGAQMQVAKARLMIRAVSEVNGGSDFAPLLKDQVGLVFVKRDTAAVAKKLVEFARENEALGIVSTLFESRVFDKSGVQMLASLPSREVLIAQLAGTLNAPIVGLARSLNEVVASFARVLNKVAEHKQGN